LLSFSKKEIVMKKAMLFVVSFLFAVSANAATLTLSPAGTSWNAVQTVYTETGSTVEGGGKAVGVFNPWSSLFDVTSDTTTEAVISWNFFPESFVKSATLTFGNDEVGIIGQWTENSNFSTTVLLAAGTSYWVDFTTVYSGIVKYGLEVSAVPIPAALWLFAPALLGFLGLRRRAQKTAVAA